jgi:hypothetical protein
MSVSQHAQGRVEVQVIESFGEIQEGQPSMRHRRRFSNTSPDQLLSLLVGLKFYGKGGLMANSTADAEEDNPDGNSRFIRNFKPFGDTLITVVAGSFHVHQELVECSRGPQGLLATIRMTFSPPNSKSDVPNGSFLWEIEPDSVDGRGACWTELINTNETRTKQIPGLKIKFGSRRVFLRGHNGLNEKAAQRIVDVLNGAESSAVFASYAQADRLAFRPGKCGPP